MAVNGNSIGTLTAPVAVRVLDIDAPLDDLDLSQGQLRNEYRSLLALVRVAKNPIGVATFQVKPDGCVTRSQLRRGLDCQLRNELSEAYARRALWSSARRVSTRAARRGSTAELFQHVHGPAGRTERGPRPSLSVVVPTCANPVSLERCLRSILRCDYDDFEVIVVENRPGTLDTARMIIAKFGDESRVRYVEEPRPSASGARNAGLARAEGEIVAFADDDVVVDPRWLRASVDALLGAPDIACVTGLILPLELESESQLLLEQFAGFGKGFQRKVYRLEEARKENPLLPYAAGMLGSGANMVMRTEVARQLGGFDPCLGPATPTRGGEDLDVLVRVLRGGHALAYEPGAIVWHEHPSGMPRLRRQVYSYGVGLGAMLTKQLIVGPKRREFFRAVPAGVRYLRDPESRKNVGKPQDCPRHLTWLERLGMLVGPFAYVLSMVVAWVRRLWASPMPSPQPLRIVRRMTIDTKPVKLVWFKEVEGPQTRFAWRHQPERDATSSAAKAAGPAVPIVVGAAVTCVVAPLLVAVGAPTALRVPAVLVLLSLVPGVAVLAAVRGRAETGLVIGASAGLAGVIAQLMLWLDAWSPGAWLYALAIACLLPLGRRLLETGGTRASISEGIAVARLRVRQAALAKSTATHIALIAGALLAWGASLAGADLSRIDGVGLLAAMPPTYYLAFALLLGGFAVAVTNDESPSWLLGAYVVAAIVVIHATTAVLYNEPRYAWVYKHLGVINLIASTGKVNRQIDIYNNWPSFFALNAWFSRTSGVAAIRYAGWAQLYFNVFNVFALRFAIRGLTRDERILWTAALLFVLGNWVGQDYLAPQAYGFALSLVVLGLCLRCGRPVADPRFRHTRWPASVVWRALGRLLPQPVQDEQPAPPPLGPRAALLIGGVCSLAVVTSHQLSPVILIVSVALLAVVTRRVPLWVPVALAAIEVWWVVLALPFVTGHFHLIDPGGAASAAPGRNLTAALPGAKLSLYAPAAVMALIAALAVVGLSRRLVRGKLDLVPACFIAAPVAIVAFQSYGGEGPYRAYLFALPWLAFLGAYAVVQRPFVAKGVRINLGRLLFAVPAIATCLLLAYFGQEVANHVTRSDVRASNWYEARAPIGSMRIDLAPNAPDRLTARYPLVSLSDPPSLVTYAGFTGHRLGSRDIPRLIKLIQEQRARPAYVVLSRLQENYALLNGLLPRGSLDSFVAALERSPSFRLIYRIPTVWIFEYQPWAARSTPHHHGGP